MTRFVMSTDRAVELAIRAAEVARGGEVFVLKRPAARLADLVAAAIEVVAPANGLDPASITTMAIEPRPGEKPYEELMSEDVLKQKFLESANEPMKRYWRRERPIEVRPVSLRHYVSREKLEPVQQFGDRIAAPGRDAVGRRRHRRLLDSRSRGLAVVQNLILIMAQWA